MCSCAAAVSGAAEASGGPPPGVLLGLTWRPVRGVMWHDQAMLAR